MRYTRTTSAGRRRCRRSAPIPRYQTVVGRRFAEGRCIRQTGRRDAATLVADVDGDVAYVEREGTGGIL